MGSLTGKIFKVLTFGESHGPALGVVVDGLPAGVPIGLAEIQRDLDRRRPGRSPFSSPRQEKDEAEIVSGLSGLTTNGAPLTILIRNHDARSADYASLSDRFRPGHADWTYFKKYGLNPQPGGGRSSGRETVGRVAAGAVARCLLSPLGIEVRTATIAVGTVKAKKRDWDLAESDPLRFADPDLAARAQTEVSAAMAEGDSLGAVVELVVTGLPAGWGEPVFDKIEARLGGAFFSIGGVRAVEFGDGLTLATLRGSGANDPLGPDGPITNRHGGIMGGLSTGSPLVARLFIRPTPTIKISQDSIDVLGNQIKVAGNGRHDPCLAPRLGPVAEAMALICLADFCLMPPARI